jgi:uncharacterized protein YecT (DUF1311 family)
MRKYILVSLAITYMPLVLFAASQVEEKHPIDRWIEACIDKDSSTAGMMKCITQGYQKWDTELNRVYKALRKQLSDAKGKETLRNAQRAWLKYRDAEFETVGAVYGSLEGTMWGPVAGGAQIEIIKNRTLKSGSGISRYLDSQ